MCLYTCSSPFFFPILSAHNLPDLVPTKNIASCESVVAMSKWQSFQEINVHFVEELVLLNNYLKIEFLVIWYSSPPSPLLQHFLSSSTCIIVFSSCCFYSWVYAFEACTVFLFLWVANKPHFMSGNHNLNNKKWFSPLEDQGHTLLMWSLY